MTLIPLPIESNHHQCAWNIALAAIKRTGLYKSAVWVLAAVRRPVVDQMDYVKNEVYYGWF